MVILLFTGVRKSSIPQRTLLRAVLQDANYETEKLVGGIGAHREEARKLIRLIKAATIGAENYPLSKTSLHRDRNAGIDVWDDEGGAPGRSTRPIC